MNILPDSRYTIVYADGVYRTIRVKTSINMGGKVVLSIKECGGWTGVGFLVDGNKIRFWRRFREQNAPERLPRIQKAVATIAADPVKAQQAYGMTEKRCARCGRDLTVPASIHHGLGPECAGKVRWTRSDNQMVFRSLAAPELRRFAERSAA